MRLSIVLAGIIGTAAPALANPDTMQFPVAGLPAPAMPPPAEPTTTAAVEAEPTISATSLPKTEREYGERWSREAGASAGFMVAPKFHSVTVAPQFGWFIADNVQISTILSLTSIKAGSDTSTIATATLEPSYHYRLDTKSMLVGGMGFGYSYIRELGNGLTFTLRGGMQYFIGKRGIFAPTVSYDFRTNKRDTMETLADFASQSALRINLGYTTIF